MELPLLRLGLLGFDAAQTAQMQGYLQAAVTPSSQWEIVAFEDADLWLIHSSRVTRGDGGALVIANPASPQSPMTIDPRQASRPVAFTRPLPPTIDAVLSISLNDAYDCTKALNLFANAMVRLCNFFALGEQVASRQSGLVEGTYHLHFESKLVAIVDLLQWQVGLAPGVKPIELSLASWRHRPNEPRHLPVDFKAQPLERLMWVYASRTRTDRLPASYRTLPIHLRRLSVLPQSWLHHDHMNVITLVSHQPRTLEDLARLSHLPMARLCACLAALYYSGSITTDPRAVQRGDNRIHSGYAALSADDQAAYAETGGHTMGMSIFDAHHFEPTRS